jgi:ribonuclease-3
VTDGDAPSRAYQITGYRFREPSLLTTALTHSSIAASRVVSNERLEFLGDAILGMVVCEELYRRFDDWLEGELTKVKSFLVSRRVCARITDQLGLTDLLVLGNGIDSRLTLPLSLRAAVLEAMIGAIFLDGGIDAARGFIQRAYADRFDSCADPNNHENYKSFLQQFVQRHHTATPRYETLDEQGPDHSKCFEVCVVINGERFPSAWGPTKKHAEQQAARRAMEQLGATLGNGDVRAG